VMLYFIQTKKDFRAFIGPHWEVMPLLNKPVLWADYGEANDFRKRYLAHVECFVNSWKASRNTPENKQRSLDVVRSFENNPLCTVAMTSSTR
jgi:hypothetical protein